MQALVFPLTLFTLLLGLFFEPERRSKQPESIPVCGVVDGSKVGLNDEGKYVGPLPGWGKYTYPVSTESDSSQFYFDQGLNLYYSYHFRESVASFKESARIDPDNAMAYWGQALAMGPYYNAAHSYQKPAEISTVIAGMNQHAPKATDKERDLIRAMNTRYSADPTDSDRAALNAAYARNLRTLVVRYPDNDIHMLYIDAVMLMHAWDFWNNDGTPKAWTPELVKLCEGVLKNNPKHPAALHYYIHLTEASRKPEVALASAEALRDLLPGVAHMVHMSSHEYERNGLYAKGVEVNDIADNNLLIYDAAAKHLSLNKHSAHYFAVQTYCAMTGGMYKDALRFANRTRKVVAPSYENTYDQYLYMLPTMVMVRMGKWDEILKDTTNLDPKWVYANLLSDFARSLAYSHQNDLESARKHLQGLQDKINDPSLTKRRIPFNSPVQIARIAEHILLGVTFAQKNQHAAAIRSFENAIALEDKLIYTEPKDWPVPSRQFMGAYLLKAHGGAQAEKVFRQDLVKNPENGWSLLGMQQSLKKQGKINEAEQFEPRYRRAFAHADLLPASPVL